MRKVTHAAWVAIGGVTGTMMFAAAIVSEVRIELQAGPGRLPMPRATAPRRRTRAPTRAPSRMQHRARHGHHGGYGEQRLTREPPLTPAPRPTRVPWRTPERSPTRVTTADTVTKADTGEAGTDTGTESDASDGGSKDAAVEAEAGCVTRGILGVEDAGLTGPALVTGFDTAAAEVDLEHGWPGARRRRRCRHRGALQFDDGGTHVPRALPQHDGAVHELRTADRRPPV